MRKLSSLQLRCTSIGGSRSSSNIKEDAYSKGSSDGDKSTNLKLSTNVGTTSNITEGQTGSTRQAKQARARGMFREQS